MKQHRYRITVEHLADAEGRPPADPGPLVFEAGNHDDIFAIVQRLRSRGELPPEAATAFAVGLKLFSEVMLEHRELPLFAGFAPHFRDFMRSLKGGAKPG
ncbi:DUF3861 domain-containing protein [Rubrivivax gelatinosus]|uniref:DUF3861 family protein n=1 Tax=Rubrivivax gelatinosus TaxID=28068 RepID=A0ABS1E0D0_RUBGE|nr:DUF3861 domain-containing protein [Rubrivivax gelatinosus]MBK1715794.1 hypothetical protein [Rubrivivax gelatinosus]